MIKLYIFVLIGFISATTYAQTQVTFYTNFGDFQAQIYDSLQQCYRDSVQLRLKNGKLTYVLLASVAMEGVT